MASTSRQWLRKTIPSSALTGSCRISVTWRFHGKKARGDAAKPCEGSTRHAGPHGLRDRPHLDLGGRAPRASEACGDFNTLNGLSPGRSRLRHASALIPFMGTALNHCLAVFSELPDASTWPEDALANNLWVLMEFSVPMNMTPMGTIGCWDGLAWKAFRIDGCLVGFLRS
jgi:hypothetical protein